MGDRSLFCLADYSEESDEWGVLFLYNRWAGTNGYYRFLKALGSRWLEHKHDVGWKYNDGQFFAELLPSSCAADTDMPVVYSAGPFCCPGPDHDVLVADVHTHSCFMVPSDTPDLREAILGMLRAGNGDRHTFDEIAGGKLFGPAQEEADELVNRTYAKEMAVRDEQVRRAAAGECVWCGDSNCPSLTNDQLNCYGGMEAEGM